MSDFVSKRFCTYGFTVQAMGVSFLRCVLD